MRKIPNISFVIPIYNEQKYLKNMLESIDTQIFSKNILIEVILVDGNSNDNSKVIAKNFIKKSKNQNISYIVLDNNKQITPYGFNIGIKHSNSNIIGFGGAHCIYPENLFSNVIYLFKNIDADVLGGGHNKIIPNQKGFISRAISALYLSPLGAGVAAYHRRSKPGYVDTVFGGFYKKSIFKEIGLFNTQLNRAQDYELNIRVRKAGYKIYFDPVLNNNYIVKTNLKQFLSRGFRTGYYLPQAWYIDFNNFSIRHFIPFSFFIYLISYSFMMIFGLTASIIGYPLFAYFLLLLLSSFWLIFFKKVGITSLLTIPLFFLYHLAYGLGSFLGIIRLSKIIINRKKNNI